MKVREYRGLTAVQKITWHSLEAKGAVRIYEKVYASLNELFGDSEAAELRAELVRRGIVVRELTNAPYCDQEINSKSDL